MTLRSCGSDATPSRPWKGEMHRPGDMVVKLDWYDRPIGMGILLEADFEGSSLRILYPTGPLWEYAHDIFALDNSRIRWRR